MVNEQAHIGIVEDDPNQALQLARILELEGFRATSHSNTSSAFKAWQYAPPDLVLSDLHLDGSDGISLLESLRQTHANLPVIIMTAFGSVETTKQALRAGAYDYLLKPLDVNDLLDTVKKALSTRALKNENVRLKKQLKHQYHFDRLVGNAPAWCRILETVDTVASSEATVLILGESGTGKELIAEALHAKGARANGPLVKVNCAALPDTLLESELFGHEKGAFTGAATARKGRFEEANGGTLFLDEIGEIPLTTQVKLLRVLQERTIERIGSNTPIAVNCRFIAATNRDLESEVKAGHFRSDLYYRLNVIPIPLPSLRERTADIPLLTAHFVDKANALNNRRVKGFTPEALDVLVRYRFPGNIRELEHLVERCVVLTSGEQISAHDLPSQVTASVDEKAAADADVLGSLWRGDLNLDALEKQLLEEAMRRSHGIQTEAARLLGIGRRALQYRLDKYGLT
jgi:DNA-binding NtrC family response regulator